MKKKISSLTISCIGASALIAILALFGILKIKGFPFDLLFSLLTLAVSGLLTLNCCEMLEKKNKLALINMPLIGLSALMVILCFWTKLDNFDTYLVSTLIIGTLSVCFNLISSTILKLGKNYTTVQLISYICYTIVSIYIILAILENIKLKGTNLKMFILFIIFSLVAMFILKVLSKKQPIEINDKGYVKITKEEYEDLLSKKSQLENLLKEGKEND